MYMRTAGRDQLAEKLRQVTQISSEITQNSALALLGGRADEGGARRERVGGWERGVGAWEAGSVRGWREADDLLSGLVRRHFSRRRVRAQ